MRSEYAAIFRDRLGFAALAALLMPVWHQASFAIATGFCAVISAVLLAWLVREAGLPRATAIVALALLFAVRGATWLSRVGSEAPALVGIVGTAVGLVYWSRAGWRSSWWIVAASLAWLMAVRPSSAVLLSAVVLLVYGVSTLRRRGIENARITLAAGATLLVELVVMHMLHSPGLTETMRDVVTHHFALPVADSRVNADFLRIERRTMGKLAVRMLQHPLVPLLACLGAWRIMRVPALRLPATCVIALAVLSAVAHPVFSEIPRLVSPATSVEAIGLALLVTSGASRISGRLTGRIAFHRRASPSASA
ncbi:MAG: hypothetical protein QOG52_348 [Frankiaceae bacterium]|nr:hypothetical protein [Frankiaceae bacterium]